MWLVLHTKHWPLVRVLEHIVWAYTYRHKLVLLQFCFLNLSFLFPVQGHRFYQMYFKAIIIFITPGKLLSSHEYTELFNVLSATIGCDIAASPWFKSIISQMVPFKRVFIQSTQNIIMLVFWESQNKLFREEFYTTDISRSEKNEDIWLHLLSSREGLSEWKQ